MSAGFDYSIKAIPTVYGGMRYRSRLEARWAAFFDQMGWRHIYEPADLSGWCPDFQWVTQGSGALVEVKPISAFHRETGRKMLVAARAADYAGALVLIGVAPFVCSERPGKLAIGWIGSIEWGGWRVAVSRYDDIADRWARACNAVQWRPSHV